MSTLVAIGGDVPGALRQYREAMRLQSDSVQPYLTAALTTGHIIGDTDLSLRLLRHAASLDGENATAFVALAGLCWGLEEKQLAVKTEQELQRLGATDALQLSRACAAPLAGRPDEARTLLQKMVGESPQDDGGIWDLSRLPGTPENHREALTSATEWTAANAQWSGDLAGARASVAATMPSSSSRRC